MFQSLVSSASGSLVAAACEPVGAPWVRPGVVVHDPAESVDGLLAAFALDLRQRGFTVRGYVQAVEDRAGRIAYFDLATGARFPDDRGAATATLRRAGAGDTDLVVIGRFAACIEATDTLHATIGATVSHGLPLLTAIAGHSIHKWHSYARQDGAMLAPDPAALWAWWGPDRLYRDLMLSTPEDPVRRIVCGPRWLMVEGPHGVGLAYLPRHPRALLPRLDTLARRSLRDLAGLITSWEPLDMAVAVAAINAAANRRDLAAHAGNGVRAFRAAAGRTVVIGAFPGVDAILPGCTVVEADPRPGEFPTAAMDSLLPGCAAAVVNSSALINRSLPRILRLTRARPVALIGPSTPLSPRLHAYGLPVLGGLVVQDADGLAAAIRAGALPREFARFGRFVHLRAPEI